MNKYLIPISIVAAGLLIAGSFYFIQSKESDKSSLPQETVEKVVDYINENILAEGDTASLIDVSEEGLVYKIKLKIGEIEYDSYVTKDGRFLFPEGYDMATGTETETEEEAAGQPADSETVELSPEQLESLAKCLTEKGDKFYGASWCSWCKRQKESFGEAVQFLPYIECIDEETNEATPECEAAGISSFPTWEIGGEKKSGFKEPEELAKLSDCSF